MQSRAAIEKWAGRTIDAAASTGPIRTFPSRLGKRFRALFTTQQKVNVEVRAACPEATQTLEGNGRGRRDRQGTGGPASLAQRTEWKLTKQPAVAIARSRGRGKWHYSLN